MKLTPNAKGAIGEQLVTADLLRRGLDVFVSAADTSRSDLIALSGKQVIRIQVKTSSVKNGVVKLSLRKNCLNPKYNYLYRKGDFDVVALVIAETGQIAYVSLTDALKCGNILNIRVAPAKNNQKRHTRSFSDFSVLPL